MQTAQFRGSNLATIGFSAGAPNAADADTAISRVSAGVLAIGNGSTGDASGNLDLATILASSSVTAGVNATSAGTFVIANGGALGVSITLQNLGATTAYNFNLPATPGTTGYVLTSQGGGSSSMTWATVVNSLTGDSLLYSNSTSTGAVTLALNTQTANYFLAGPTSGSANTPTFRALVVGDLPTTGTWAFAGTLSGALTFTGNATSTLGTATPGTNPSTAGFEIWQNTTPTVTGASTTLAIKTGTAPINVTSNTWRYTFAVTESGAGSNAWVGASVTISGYTTTATGNNGTFVIIASTTTTFDVVNATGTTADGGTPVVISSAVVNSPILQIAGTVNTGTAGTLNSVADVWLIQNVLGSVAPNPTSTLTFTHSGSSGTASVAAPIFSSTLATGAANIGSAAGGLYITPAGGRIDIIFSSSCVWEFGNSKSFAGGSGQAVQFTSNANPASGGLDTGISRISAGILGVGTGTAGSVAGTLYCARLDSSSADMQGNITSAPSGISCTAVTVAVGGATGTFTVTSTEEFVIGDTVTLSSTGWTASKGLNSSVATVASITNSTTLVLTYVSGGPWIAGTYTAQTGTLTQTGGTVASYTYATAYTNTPTVVVTPTSNCGAFYISSSSTTGFSITYANSGTQTFNYHVMGNPT